MVSSDLLEWLQQIVWVSEYLGNLRYIILLFSGCGGLFHSSNGYLATPNYPSSYPHNSECIWDINVDPGYYVALSFNPPFDMEHHGTCDYDFVEVSDLHLWPFLWPFAIAW